MHEARRESSKEYRRKTKAEEKRKPTKRILARLEAKKKDIIKSTGYRRPRVRKKLCQTKEPGQDKQPKRNSLLNFQNIT